MYSTAQKICKNRPFSEKSAENRRFIPIFPRFFTIRFFHPKIFSSTTEIQYFSEKSVDLDDFFVPGCNTYNLSKGLLIKYWWCLTSTSWTPSTSSSSTSHLHSLNDKFNLTTVSPMHKHSLETLFIHINQCIHIVLTFIGNARQSIIHLKHFYQQKFHF